MAGERHVKYVTAATSRESKCLFFRWRGETVTMTYVKK